MQLKKKPSQSERLLSFLKERGVRGATGIEIDRALDLPRYGARIYDLRKQGHQIDVSRGADSQNGASVFRYTYVDPTQADGSAVAA